MRSSSAPASSAPPAHTIWAGTGCGSSSSTPPSPAGHHRRGDGAHRRDGRQRRAVCAHVMAARLSTRCCPSSRRRRIDPAARSGWRKTKRSSRTAAPSWRSIAAGLRAELLDARRDRRGRAAAASRPGGRTARARRRRGVSPRGALALLEEPGRAEPSCGSLPVLELRPGGARTGAGWIAGGLVVNAAGAEPRASLRACRSSPARATWS